MINIYLLNRISILHGKYSHDIRQIVVGKCFLGCERQRPDSYLKSRLGPCIAEVLTPHLLGHERATEICTTSAEPSCRQYNDQLHKVTK